MSAFESRRVAGALFVGMVLGAGVTVVGFADAAHAGSDSPTPYTVDADGVTLPAGQTFPAHGHVNLKTSAGGKGVHFDPNNGHPGGAWIGQSFIPWSAFGLNGCDTVSWVQVSLYDEHHGEGGQAPVTVAPCNVPEPPPEPPVTPTPTVVPTPEPSSSEIPNTSHRPELAETGPEPYDGLLFGAMGAALLGAVVATFGWVRARRYKDGA